MMVLIHTEVDFKDIEKADHRRKMPQGNVGVVATHTTASPLIMTKVQLRRQV